MTGIMDKTKFIRQAVSSHSTDARVIRLLKELESDMDPLPMYKFPVGVLATAALIVLGEVEDKSDDENIQLMQEVLLNS